MKDWELLTFFSYWCGFFFRERIFRGMKNIFKILNLIFFSESRIKGDMW